MGFGAPEAFPAWSAGVSRPPNFLCATVPDGQGRDISMPKTRLFCAACWRHRLWRKPRFRSTTGVYAQPCWMACCGFHVWPACVLRHQSPPPCRRWSRRPWTSPRSAAISPRCRCTISPSAPPGRCRRQSAPWTVRGAAALVFLWVYGAGVLFFALNFLVLERHMFGASDRPWPGWRNTGRGRFMTGLGDCPEFVQEQSEE